MLPVIDAETAASRLEFIYQRDKAWFNALPPHSPRDMIDRLKSGLAE